MKRTQLEAIASALQAGHAVTPLMALRRWGCFRLAARISDLKAEGWQIERTMVERDGTRFAEYRLSA